MQRVPEMKSTAFMSMASTIWILLLLVACRENNEAPHAPQEVVTTLEAHVSGNLLERAKHLYLYWGDSPRVFYSPFYVAEEGYYRVTVGIDAYDPDNIEVWGVDMSSGQVWPVDLNALVSADLFFCDGSMDMASDCLGPSEEIDTQDGYQPLEFKEVRLRKRAEAAFRALDAGDSLGYYRFTSDRFKELCTLDDFESTYITLLAIHQTTVLRQNLDLLSEVRWIGWRISDTTFEGQEGRVFPAIAVDHEEIWVDDHGMRWIFVDEEWWLESESWADGCQPSAALVTGAPSL